MTDEDEIQILLRRIADLQAQLERETIGDTSTPDTLVVQTVTVGTYPTSAQRFYGVQSVDVSGTEAENQTGSYGTPSGTFYAFNVGASIPSSGTKLRVTLVGGFWLFRY